MITASNHKYNTQVTGSNEQIRCEFELEEKRKKNEINRNETK